MGKQFAPEGILNVDNVGHCREDDRGRLGGVLAEACQHQRNCCPGQARQRH